MCCAVDYPQIQRKMGLSERFQLSYALPKKQMKKKVAEKKNLLKCEENTAENAPDSQKSDATDVSMEPVTQTVETKQSQQKEKEEKKKKKWKPVPLIDCGFNMSLFPRPTRPEIIDPEEEERILNKIEREIEEYDATVEKYQDFDVQDAVPFEGTCQKKDKFSRADRDRKVQKAGRQVKDKYCTSVKNNKGRKKLYVHHRLFKLINLEENRLFHYLPSRSKCRDIDVINKDNKSSNETRSKLKTRGSAPHVPASAPVQNLRFALQQSNAASDLESDLVNLLINLQHRDLTPEDYEVLLRLDDSVAPKTIDKTLLDNFKTDTVDESCAGDICPVCMDMYELGQNRKFLPCNHVFHAKCIDMWLENSSRNCPVDGLPVDEGS